MRARLERVGLVALAVAAAGCFDYDALGGGAATSLLPDPGFERGYSGWEPYQLMDTWVDSGRSGKAVRLCAKQGTDLGEFNSAVFAQPILDGIVYRVTAWVRVSQPLGSDVRLVLDPRVGQGIWQGQDQGTPSDKSGDWQPLEVDHRPGGVPPPADSRMNVYVLFVHGGDPTACFELNDLVVEAH